MSIKNEPKYKFGLLQAIREQLEHRALWMYLLCDEAKKKGLPPEEYAPDEGYPIEAKRVENVLSADLLIGHLGLADRTAEYLVRWNADTKYLCIRAEGNVAGFYVDGKLISDFYLYGDTWVIDLRRIDTREGRIKIQPLTEEDARGIYFEKAPALGEVAPTVYGFDKEVILI